MSFLSRLFSSRAKKPQKSVETQTPEKTKPVEVKKTDPNLCKCVHCHREFHKEDFLGICTSRECENAEIIIQDIDSLQYLKEIGHRRLLLREGSKSAIPSLDKEESILTDLATKKGKCTSCDSSIFFYACPHCRHTMPFITAADLEKVIAPAGIAASGKTSYMTVLIDYLLNNPIYNSRFELTTRFTETKDYKEYIDNKYKLLFRGDPLPMNLPEDVPKPYIIKTIAKNHDSKEESSIHTLWYDFAGEALTDSGSYNPILQNLRAVKGLFLFVDPRNIPKTVKELKLDNIYEPILHHDGTVMNTISEILNTGEEGENVLKNKFIAVILNKIDLFKNKNSSFFRDDSVVWQPSPHHSLGAFSLVDFDQVNQEVEQYIKMNHGVLYNQLQPCFNDNKDNIGFFAVSTLGQNPNSQGLLTEDINPIRIEDPFYWMLWKMNSISAAGEETDTVGYEPEPVSSQETDQDGGGLI